MEILWVDDLRDPAVFMKDEMVDHNVTWAKTYQEAIDLLDDGAVFHMVCLDNDLGEEMEGRHVFDYIEFLLYDGKHGQIESIRIHSDNSSAVRYMMAAKGVMKDKYNINLTQVTYKSF